MKSQMGNIMIPLLSGALLVAIIVAALLFWQNQQLVSQLVSSPPPPVEITEEVENVKAEESETQEPPVESKPVVTEKVVYTPNPSWQTYTDTQGGFSIQYPEYEKVGTSTPGKGVGFMNCNQVTGKEICLGGDGLAIHTDYDGGSRRSWFNSKYSDFVSQSYMQDLTIQGINALVVMDGNTGGSTGSWVLIPKGNKMYVFSTYSGWNPETGDKSELTRIKNKLATFKFL